MRQITILDFVVDLATSTGHVVCAFWLASPKNRVPLRTGAVISAIPTATTYSARQASHAYTAGTIVIPTTPNGFAYTASAGTTASGADPVWPTVPGGTVTDGGVTWTLNAVDLNSGVTAAEQTLLNAGLIQEVLWTSSQQTTVAALQTEVQAAYAQLQTNLNGSAYNANHILDSFNGASWSAAT